MEILSFFLQPVLGSQGSITSIASGRFIGSRFLMSAVSFVLTMCVGKFGDWRPLNPGTGRIFSLPGEIPVRLAGSRAFLPLSIQLP